jgi:large subunit ribosomal protein L17
MRHHNKNRKFGREKGQRTALLKSLAESLIIHGKITTTEEKAKELRPMVEKLVTKAREGTSASKISITRKIQSVKAIRSLVKLANEKYKERPGGYTRIIKLFDNRGVTGGKAVIEFV